MSSAPGSLADVDRGDQPAAYDSSRRRDPWTIAAGVLTVAAVAAAVLVSAAAAGLLIAFAAAVALSAPPKRSQPGAGSAPGAGLRNNGWLMVAAGIVVPPIALTGVVIGIRLRRARGDGQLALIAAGITVFVGRMVLYLG